MSQFLPRLALEKLLPRLWSKGSSLDTRHWQETNAGWGQSAATALVLHDHLGGTLLRTLFRSPDGKSGVHYLNLLPDGTLLDLTRPAYPAGTHFLPSPEAGAKGLQNATRIHLTSQGFDPDKGLTLRDYLMYDTITRTAYLQLASTLLRTLEQIKGTA